MAILTRPKTPHQISTIGELAESQMRIVVQDYILEIMPEDLRNQSMASFNSRLNDDLAEIISDTHFATIINKRTYLYYYDNAYDPETEAQSIYSFNEEFLSYYLYILFQKDHPLIEILDSTILMMHQSGLVIKAYWDAMSFIKNHGKQRVKSTAIPLNSSQLQVAFYILHIGQFISLVVLVIEMVDHYHCGNKIFE